MEHRFIPIVLLCLIFNYTTSFAQDDDIIAIHGESTVEFPDYLSMVDVKKLALDEAIVNALEKEFGVAIIEGNSTYAKNIVTGEKAETSTIFNSIGNHWVKGEVLEVLNASYKEVLKTVLVEGEEDIKIKHIECKVEIRAREIIDNVIDFELLLLNCLNINCQTNLFKAETDDFYLFFRSPASGYLAVFLDDGTQTQRLFPYRNMGKQFERGVPMQANNSYYLFNDDKNNDYFSSAIDEYVFETNQKMEQDRLFAVFSFNPIVQPFMQNETNDNSLSDTDIALGWELPESLASEEFQRWLIESRIKNKNIEVKIIDIIIEK